MSKKNLSVAPREDSLIYLAGFRARLRCQQCSKPCLGLGLLSRTAESVLGCVHVPLKVKTARALDNESTAKPCTSRDAEDSDPPAAFTEPRPTRPNPASQQPPRASWPANSCAQKSQELQKFLQPPPSACPPRSENLSATPALWPPSPRARLAVRGCDGSPMLRDRDKKMRRGALPNPLIPHFS